MGHFATGVSVVTARAGQGAPAGMTANAVTSVSLRPLLLLVCVLRESSSYEPIVQSRAYAVNVLQEDDVEMARRFAHDPPARRFDGVEFRSAKTGSPILERALAWVDCRVAEVHEAGDHSIIVGEVLDGSSVQGDPLVFFRGKFGGFTP
jgi:3-hydroxy-9,10-secoandrosta-1,3,5(10)-triene-9,17-dione monooxygenase reductase component